MYATDTTESIVSEIDLKKLVSAILNIQYLKSQTIRRLRNDEKHVHYDLHKEVREMPGNQSIIGEFKKLKTAAATKASLPNRALSRSIVLRSLHVG